MKKYSMLIAALLIVLSSVGVVSANGKSQSLSFGSNSYWLTEGGEVNTSVLFESNRKVQEVSSLAVYKVADLSVVNVSSGGHLTGIKSGTTTITATYKGMTATTVVTVAAAPITVKSIYAENNNIQLGIGEAVQLKVFANYSDGTTREITSDVAFFVEDTTIASVRYPGIVDGMAVGQTGITIKYNGAVNFVSVNVN